MFKFKAKPIKNGIVLPPSAGLALWLCETCNIAYEEGDTVKDGRYKYLCPRCDWNLDWRPRKQFNEDYEVIE